MVLDEFISEYAFKHRLRLDVESLESMDEIIARFVKKEQYELKILRNTKGGFVAMYVEGLQHLYVCKFTPSLEEINNNETNKVEVTSLEEIKETNKLKS